jgi:glutamate 5-kinase
MRGVKTVVVKLGSSTVSDHRGRLRRGLIAGRVAEIAALVGEGQRVVVVSSGAIACGQSVLGMSERPRQIAALQAASAVGQGKLFDAYARCLRGSGFTAAQILLTSSDFAQRLSYVNARSTLRRLLGWGVVPIINENDTTATDEIRFGDNDVLAAQVAIMLRADLLLLLTDRDGLFSSDPVTDSQARLIDRVDDIGDLHGLDVRERSRRGVGGMRGKVAAALMAAAADVSTVIANGEHDGVITAAAHGLAVGTLVPPRPAHTSAFKLWLRYAKPVRGTLEIDAGAARALASGGSSLLAVGVVAVHGSFGAGDAVAIVAGGGREVARGLTTIGARELRRIAGMRSDAARALVPHADEEVVHRDALVLIEEDAQ